VNAIRRANRLAARLFTARGADLLRYVRRRIRNDADARDIAHETYLRFIRLAKPDRIDNPEAYLFRIAGNLLWEHRLRTRHVQDAVEEMPAEEPATSEPTPLELTVADQSASRVKAALDGLKPNARTAIVLHLRDGLTYEQIGKHMGISVSMVKKHLSSALAHCRGQLRAQDL
jgi:RNA polymerase sigma factor (sigma-70 family)